MENENTYRTFFGITQEPFRTDPALTDILQTDELKAVNQRFEYAVRLGGAALVTGEIGSGKSTALRYASEQLHPSEYKTFISQQHLAPYWNCIVRSHPKWALTNPVTLKQL